MKAQEVLVMLVKIQNLGRCLALRIPIPFAEELSLKEGSLVELFIEEGRLVVEPAAVEKYQLHKLLSEVIDANIHGEVSLGKPAGKEVW